VSNPGPLERLPPSPTPQESSDAEIPLSAAKFPGRAGGRKAVATQMQEMYGKFNEWREKFKANLVDLGGRLGSGKVGLPKPAPDGPFIEVKELVGGYMIVSAPSLDEALAIARECPGLVRPGSGVEVIEIHSPG
jgi:hypothetical protein